MRPCGDLYLIYCVAMLLHYNVFAWFSSCQYIAASFFSLNSIQLSWTLSVSAFSSGAGAVCRFAVCAWYCMHAYILYVLVSRTALHLVVACSDGSLAMIVYIHMMYVHAVFLRVVLHCLWHNLDLCSGRDLDSRLCCLWLVHLVRMQPVSPGFGCCVEPPAILVGVLSPLAHHARSFGFCIDLNLCQVLFVFSCILHGLAWNCINLACINASCIQCNFVYLAS